MLYFVSRQVALESQTTYDMASSCFTVAFVTKAAISAGKALGFDIKQEQLEVVVKFAMGRDVFAVLPTGFGKLFATNAYLEFSTKSALMEKNTVL